MTYSGFIRETYPNLSTVFDRSDSGDSIDAKFKELKKDVRKALDAVETNLVLDSVNPTPVPTGQSVSFNSNVEGTVETSVGAIWLAAGTLSFKALIGCQDNAHSATLKLYRQTNSTLLTTIGGVVGGLTNRAANNVVIANADWYYLTLVCSSNVGTAMLRGLAWS